MLLVAGCVWWLMDASRSWALQMTFYRLRAPSSAPWLRTPCERSPQDRQNSDLDLSVPEWACHPCVNHLEYWCGYRLVTLVQINVNTIMMPYTMPLSHVTKTLKMTCSYTILKWVTVTTMRLSKYQWSNPAEYGQMDYMKPYAYIRNIPYAGLILVLLPANERRRYFVTMSLIGWAQAQNQPWYV